MNLPVPLHGIACIAAADATHMEHFRQTRVTIGGACIMRGVSDWCSHGCKRGQNLVDECRGLAVGGGMGAKLSYVVNFVG